MRVLIPALALLASLALAVPAAAQVPGLPALPPLPPAPPVNQCLGSTTIVHLCAAFGHSIPKVEDPVPPTIEPPAPPTCTPGDPMVLGFLLSCSGSVVINGRANTITLSVYRGIALPGLPAL